MKKIINHTLIIFLVCFSVSATAQDTFIEGFPDIPKLDIIKQIIGEPVVFDTPSGTVAEITFRTKNKGENALNAYEEALISLGWTCKHPPKSLACVRGANTVVLLDDAPSENNGRIILRLSPTK